jgi:hypothetical protein
LLGEHLGLLGELGFDAQQLVFGEAAALELLVFVVSDLGVF